MMHSMRASSSSVTLKVDVRELAKLLAENNNNNNNNNEDGACDDEGWHRIESGEGRTDCGGQKQITAVDALMLIRVRGASSKDLRSVYQDYETSKEARAILDRAADAKGPVGGDPPDDDTQEDEDPWCWRSLWRETTRLWQTTAASGGGPPPCSVQ